jgi:phage terminase small subunit
MTPKQQRFVEEYLVDLNASAAARRAGYRGDPNTVGPRMLANVGISAFIAEKRQQIAERTQRKVEDVLADIAKVRQDAMQPVTDPETGITSMLSHKEALKALELEGRHLGAFERDNAQKKPQLTISGFRVVAA